MHDGYNSANSFIHDVGLMRLATPIITPYVDFRAKLAMRGQYTPTGTIATVVGWGRNEVNWVYSTVPTNY